MVELPLQHLAEVEAPELPAVLECWPSEDLRRLREAAGRELCRRAEQRRDCRPDPIAAA